MKILKSGCHFGLAISARQAPVLIYEKPPDFKQAEQYANSAQARVPHWQYVQDILLPQIRAGMKDDKKSE